MSTTEGASTQSAGDPALDAALTEMSSEGTFDAGASMSELGEASQGTDSASAAPAAPSVSTGDSGSVQAQPSSTASAPTGADPAADPLAGTEPFRYGEGKTLQGVYRVPGEGLMVPEAHVASVTQLAERADHLDRVTRELTDQNTAFERLSSWTVRDSEGKEQTVTGPQGLEAMRVEHARQSSLIAVVDSILTDPAKLLSLLAKDAQGNIVVDPTAIETLQMRAHIAAGHAEQQARAQFAKLGTPPTPSSSGPTNYSASAPPLIKQAAGANLAALLPEDHAELAADIGRYVRPVTERDRQYDPTKKLGAPIVDAAFGARVQRLANLRASATATAKAAETAGKHNAGMDRGRQPAKAPPKAPAAPAKSDERKPKADWESPLTSALAEMGVPR